MKRLVKVYIDVPSAYYDPEVVEEYFRCALGRAYHGGLHPYDPRHVLGEAMTIDRVQVGPKKKAGE